MGTGRFNGRVARAELLALWRKEKNHQAEILPGYRSWNKKLEQKEITSLMMKPGTVLCCPNGPAEILSGGSDQLVS
jgi:hypothetical protein